MINHNERGILVPVGDEQKLYEAMKKVLTDESFSYRIEKNASKIRYKYNVSSIVDEWRAIIEK